MSKWRSAVVVAGAAVVGALAFAAPAAGHVTVNPTEAVQGGFARLAFRVPTEGDRASTVKVEVVLPENAPVASVSTMPVPGWTVTVQRRTLDKPLDVHGAQVTQVVSSIIWTASADAAVKPGQFQEFPVSMGPLPKVDTMVFKALQTYSDGTVVRWIEAPGPDGKEPAEDPAPVLKLVPATALAADADQDEAGDDDDDNGGSGGLAVGLAVAGLIAGLGGLGLGGLAYLRTRRPAA